MNLKASLGPVKFIGRQKKVSTNFREAKSFLRRSSAPEETPARLFDQE